MICQFCDKQEGSCKIVFGLGMEIIACEKCEGDFKRMFSKHGAKSYVRSA